MYRFLKNIFFLGLIIFCVFYLLDKAISTGLRKSNMVMYDNLTKIFNDGIDADLIINGSSKAYVQVNPRIIDSVLQINSFNLGLDGNAFVPQKLVYQLYEENYGAPKAIVQIVSNTTLEVVGENLYNYIKFAPYLDLDKVHKMTEQYQDFSFLDYRLPLLKYSGHPIEAVDGVFGFFNVHFTKSPLYKGYLPNDIVWDGSFEKFKEANQKGILFELNPIMCKIFEDYVKDCKRKNIAIFLVYPPVFHEFIPYVRNRNQIVEYYTYVSNKYKVPFLDFSQDELSLERKYFYNSQHLNERGSALFTKKLAMRLHDFDVGS